MEKLRVGILLDSLEITAWEYEMIERIVNGNYAEIVLVVKKRSAQVPDRSLPGLLKRNLNLWMYKLYMAGERVITKPAPDAFAKKNLNGLINNATLLEVDCVEKKFSDYIRPEDIDVIKGYKVDVFIRLGFRILRGEILKTAKMGVWSYHHGDNHKYRGGPAAFWEVFRQERQIGSVLQILTEDLDGGEVLYRSYSSVLSTVKATMNNYYWKTALFIPRKLQELHRAGEDSFFRNISNQNGHPNFYSGRNYTLPRNSEFLKLFFPRVWNVIKKKIGNLFHFEQWILLYAFSENDSFSKSLFRYKKIIPPKDRYWADPCVVKKGEKYFIFFEEVIYGKTKERGHICVMEIDKKGKRSEPVIILQKPYHLSYPFVFEYKGEFYLIPESEENSTIELYRAVHFPYEWEFKMNLMENIKAVDSTVFFKDDKCWLFANVRELEGTSYSEELFLFSTDDLLSGRWRSHPANPVVSDVGSSRPAGRIFSENGKWYRPSQDCSLRYGHSMAINEITELSESSYRESKVSGIYPEWDKKLVATHTFSFDKGLSVVDALIRRRKRWLSFSQNL